MKAYGLESPLVEVTTNEYFATEVCSITRAGPCSRLVFATARVGITDGRTMRETVVSVVIPTEMLALLAEHIRTGIPARAQAFTAWGDDGYTTIKGH